MNTSAHREIIPRDPASSFRWRVHGYPDSLARWNFHQELEIHLIRRGNGRYIIGDVVGAFAPGHLVLVGSDLPHDWISDLEPGELIEDRDVVLQLDPGWLEGTQRAIPELRNLDPLLVRARRGIEFHGETARRGAETMEAIGLATGVAAIVEVLRLLEILSSAPATDWHLLSTRAVDQAPGPETHDVMAHALDYIFANIDTEVRLSVAARLAGMSESAFSRTFKAASGQTFSEMVKRLRLTQACRILEQTDATVTAVAQAVGFSNLSNFNRRFREEYQMTPSQYRRAQAAQSRETIAALR
ncbi:AraC family transcriptional regulator [Leifsonia kafniensis]|uniref:AraC family transcriptional regulator n=1 Tax=Leifsonia kafniensis TaxID=475957 RepID=A0ABP7KNS8_9MICO